MWHAFGLLAKLKGLRGTKFDVFGYTQERQAERAMIADYRTTIEQLLSNLTADSLDTAIAVANLPEKVRGFGHVKEKAMQAYQLEKASLLAQPTKRAAA